MKNKKLTPEEKLQKIIDQIIKEKEDNISVSKLMDIIGIESSFHKKESKPFMPSTVYRKFHKNNEYIENYIS